MAAPNKNHKKTKVKGSKKRDKGQGRKREKEKKGKERKGKEKRKNTMRMLSSFTSSHTRTLFFFFFFVCLRNREENLARSLLDFRAALGFGCGLIAVLTANAGMLQGQLSTIRNLKSNVKYQKRRVNNKQLHLVASNLCLFIFEHTFTHRDTETQTQVRHNKVKPCSKAKC